MKTRNYMLIVTFAITSANVVVADEMPPSGPYQSFDINQAEQTYQQPMAPANPASQPMAQVPQWAQQQAERDELIRQHNQRRQAAWGKYALQQPAAIPEWVKQQRAQMEQPTMPMPSAGGQAPASQWQGYQTPPPNQYQNMDPRQQYFPSARGPVYGPNVPPPQYQQPSPNYRQPAFQNAYPPVWRR